MADPHAPSTAGESGARTDATGMPAGMPGCAAFGLGALAAVCWLAALLLDSRTRHLPGWAREAPHAALVLAVPALIIVVAQAHSDRRSTRRWPMTLLALLAMVVASLPGLLLVSQAPDLASLPLRVPTLGLGIALGYAAPVRYGFSAMRAADGAAPRRWLEAAAGGAGFTLLLAPVAFVLVTTAIATASECPPPPAQIDCGARFGVGMALEIAICGATLLTLLLALAMAALGGIIGRALHSSPAGSGDGDEVRSRHHS